MPVSAQVGSLRWDNDEVANAGRDGRFTPWTLVGLYSLIRLHGVHNFVVETCDLREEVGRRGWDRFGHPVMVERIGASLSCLQRCR
jgi:hypothetical protein